MKSNSSDDEDTPSVEMKTMMMTTSRHYFTETNDDGVVDGKADFAVSIIENMKEEYGLLVWPCSVILAEYVWQQRLRFSGIAFLQDRERCAYEMSYLRFTLIKVRNEREKEMLSLVEDLLEITPTIRGCGAYKLSRTLVAAR